MTPDSGGIMLESLETEVSLCLFPFSSIYQARFIAWKRPEIHLIFRQNLPGYHFEALALWSQIRHPSSVSYFLTRSKKYMCLKIPDCKDKKEGFPLCECQESIFFKAHLRIMNRWTSQVKSTPHPGFFPAEGQHRCMAANPLATQIRWVYLVL